MEGIERWTLTWEHGDATVQSLGGMLAPVRFALGDGRSVSPLHVAPWDAEERWPGVLRALRGEWPCLPFGMVQPPPDLPPGFIAKQADDQWDHGCGANHRWQLREKTSHAITLGIDYPDDQPIARLERTIEADPHAPALTVSLTVHARRDVVLPLGLHPTFAVPEAGLEVRGCPYRIVHSYPVPQEPGVSQISPNTTFASLHAVPTAAGEIDVTRLPLTHRTEELMQIEGCQPPFVLRYPTQESAHSQTSSEAAAAEHVDVLLDWDTAQLPDALLWISNGGRAHAPWSGRHFALGVEPVNSFFDLARVTTPPPAHPLANRSGLAFEAGTPRTITYRLSAHTV